ncbi:hypothetical protein EYC80_001991 [Monilinia laxa]|uniref:Uncharacterized protein n=1 Tax=Monilinia laxa TaxID=61186 RepID=A0A5N6K6M8_MONLA|nr:hypothetical protein EYC80_001991 [Monilinia laxa]
MSDYNLDHPGFTQEHIQHLQENPLEACQRENASLRIRLNSLNQMLIEAKAESETRLNRIKQVKEERDAAFEEGERYTRGEMGAQIGVLRRERYEAEIKSTKLEEKDVEMQNKLLVVEEELEELRRERGRDHNTTEMMDEDSFRLLRGENEKHLEELSEVKEILGEREIYIKHLEEEVRGRSMSDSVAEAPPVDSERVKILTEQVHVLIAERDDLSQQLEIVTENLMGSPKVLTPKENTADRTTPEGDKEPLKSRFSASTDPNSPEFYAQKSQLHGPSPLRQSSTPESEEYEEEYEVKIKMGAEAERKEQEQEQEEEEEEESGEEVGNREEGIKESIEMDENDKAIQKYRKNKEGWSKRLTDRIKKVEKRNMFLERYHDMRHIIRAILSLTPVHFEALRERKEGKRKERGILLEVMMRERNSLRKQIASFEKRLQVLAKLRSKDGPDIMVAQDFLLNQQQWEMDKEAMNTYRRLYEDAEFALKKMMRIGADVDAHEVTELRKERDILKKRKEELEEEIDGPLGLREQLSFIAAEDTKDINIATQLTRVKAELEWCTKERDAAMGESKVEEKLISMKELMGQLSCSIEIDVYPSEEKEEQYKELAKNYQQCQRELSDEKERVKTLEKFLEEKYIEYGDIAGDENDDSLSARLARGLIELFETRRKLMERTIQRNSLTKSAVGCLATVLREIETLQKEVYTLKRHPNRDPGRPLTDVDFENQETIVKLEYQVDQLRKQLNKAQCGLSTANMRTRKAKDELDNYLELSWSAQSHHPRITSLRKYRERPAMDPNATPPEVIAHLKNQLKESDDILDSLSARIDVLTDENGDLNTERVEIAERRLEDCMDLVDGPLAQKEAWNSLKGLLAEAREVLKIKMNEWKKKDKERDLAVQSLENLLKESEERASALAKLLNAAQEYPQSEGTNRGRIAELEEQLHRNEERIQDLLREKDEKKAEADGLESFLRACETHTTQVEEQLSKNEERMHDLQYEKDSHKAEAERLDDILKANETKTAEFFKTLREEEEEQYREEIERLHELLLFKEEEDEQYRDEIERLHELHKASEEKVAELLDISLKTSQRLSDLEAEITWWKDVAGESIEETEKLHKKLADLEAEIELLHSENKQHVENQTEGPKQPMSPIPTSIKPMSAPKSKKSTRKAPKKKAPKKDPQESTYSTRKDSTLEPSDEELEEPKVLKPQTKPNISIRREIARSGPSPSPAPSLTIKLKSKAHATKNKVERKWTGPNDPTWKNDGGEEEPDDEIPAEEVVPDSPVDEIQMVEGLRRSRRTRNKNPIYTGEIIVEGPGIGQKRKASEGGIEGTGKKGKK